MVSIVPQETNFDLIGKMIGQGLSRSLPAAVERGIERGQIQSGLRDVENLSAKNLQGLSPFQVIAKILAPFAGTRQGAQYAEALLPSVGKFLEAQQAAGLTGGVAQQGAAGQQAEGPRGLEGIEQYLRERNRLPSFAEPAGATAPPMSRPERELGGRERRAFDPEYYVERFANELGELYFPSLRRQEDLSPEESRRPQRPLQRPKPISLSEERRFRRELIREGVTSPDEQNRIIDRLKTYQNELYEADKEGFRNVREYQEARNLEDQRFQQAIQPLIKNRYGSLNSDEMKILQSIARVNENVGGDEARWNATTQQFDKLIRDPLEEFERSPGLPLASLIRPEDTQKRLDSARSIVHSHLKAVSDTDIWPKDLRDMATDFLRQNYATSLAQKGWGTAQAAYAINDLGDAYRARVPKIPGHERHGVKAVGGAAEFLKPEQKNQYVNKLENVLRGHLKPDDSLILAREQALANGYNDDMFREALRLAERNGLTLSDFQRSDVPKLDIPARWSIGSILEGTHGLLSPFMRRR